MTDTARTIVVCAVLAAAALGGCTDDEDDEPSPVNRLAVVEVDGRVVTMAPDGTDREVVTGAGETGFQPIWSPDGSQLAFSLIGTGLAVTDVRSGTTRHTATDPSPFYLQWSPAGDRIAVLRNDAAGIALEIADVTGDEIASQVVDVGQPYYFAWRPDGDRLVAHVGSDRLDLLEPGADPEPLGVEPGTFQAPQWTDRGILTVTLVDGGEQLVLAGEDGDLSSITRLSATAVFGVDPTGRRLAVQTIPTPSGETVPTTLVDGTLTPGRLHVVDLDSGAVEEVTATPAVAFFWSPDGGRLLFLELGDVPNELRWSTWSDGTVAPGPSFLPAIAWVRQFLPFYDQYARSMTPWSPDSTAFAFPGSIDDEAGIWVHDITDDTTDLVAEGIWVAWSHQ